MTAALVIIRVRVEGVSRDQVTAAFATGNRYVKGFPEDVRRSLEDALDWGLADPATGEGPDVIVGTPVITFDEEPDR